MLIIYSKYKKCTVRSRLQFNSVNFIYFIFYKGLLVVKTIQNVTKNSAIIENIIQYYYFLLLHLLENINYLYLYFVAK